MFVLALDCSTAQGSVALGWRAGNEPPVVHWQTGFPAGRGHGGKLFTALQEAHDLIHEHGDRLEQIVVGLGPGSYSGVRQAIAAATGLAAATGAQLYGRPSPVAVPITAVPFHIVADARRGAYYYTAVENGLCLAGPELLPDLPSLQARLNEHPDWTALAMENLPPGLPPETPLGWPGADRLLHGPAGSFLPTPLEPIYLRPVAFTLPKKL